MKILIVSSYFPPHVGGVEVVAQQQAGSLTGAGHTVIVGTSRTGPAEAHREHHEGYDIVRLPVNNTLERRTGVPYPLIGPAFWRALAGLIAWCDVVHVHDVLYLPPQLAALLAHRAGKPIYVTQHAGRVHHRSRVVLAAARLSAALARRFIWDHARRVASTPRRSRRGSPATSTACGSGSGCRAESRWCCSSAGWCGRRATSG
jgi:D-inositol-3-phosphate glycosyltransferase